MNAILTRRSTRKFLDKPVEPEKLERILRAAMQSPTGADARDWEFLVITDKEKQIAVSQAAEVTQAAKNAPVLLLPLANLERRRGGELLWSCDMGAVTQTILLQIEAEGLGGVWLSLWPYAERVDHVRKVLSLPEHIVPYCAIPIGYREREKPFVDRYDPEKVHWERY